MYALERLEEKLVSQCSVKVCSKNITKVGHQNIATNFIVHSSAGVPGHECMHETSVYT